MDSFCGVDTNGAVWCTGYGIGLTPEMTDAGPRSSVWIDDFGTIYLDDVSTWRAAQARAECVVNVSGLYCRAGATLGTAGHVVDGGYVTVPDATGYVYLEDDGAVYLYQEFPDSRSTTVQHLVDMPVLAIAYNYYADSVCGVYNDGSLACWGSNTQGKLGTGTEAALAVDTVVLPAGTFDLSCR